MLGSYEPSRALDAQFFISFFYALILSFARGFWKQYCFCEVLSFGKSMNSYQTPPEWWAFPEARVLSGACIITFKWLSLTKDFICLLECLSITPASTKSGNGVESFGTQVCGDLFWLTDTSGSRRCVLRMSTDGLHFNDSVAVRNLFPCSWYPPSYLAVLVRRIFSCNCFHYCLNYGEVGYVRAQKVFPRVWVPQDDLRNSSLGISKVAMGR